MVRISKAENVLGAALRSSNVAFKQQVRLGHYTVDFMLPPNIVVECEGIVHEANQDRGARRTQDLETMGYKVFRFRNYDIFSRTPQLASMLKGVQRTLRDTVGLSAA